MESQSEPQPGIVSKAKVIRVIDGDTLEVEVTRKFCIRLIHPDGRFNCPEMNTELGKQAKKVVEGLIEMFGDEVTISIPTHNPETLMDVNSFNRILGEVWLRGKRLTDLLLDRGLGEIK